MILKEKKYFKNKGVTLIEVILVLSILTVVISTAFSMGLFGNRIFNKGTSKSELQSNIRYAADYISKQLRYASNVSLTNDDDDSSKIADNQYIYVDSNGMLKHFANGVTKDIVKISDSNFFEALKFNASNGKNVVSFTVSGWTKDESYSVSSSVYLLNQNTGVSIQKTENPTAVSYTSGVPFTTDVNTNDVTSITISAPRDDVDLNSTIQLTVSVLPVTASSMVTWQVDPEYGYIDPVNNILHVLSTAPTNSTFEVTATSVLNPSKSDTKKFKTTNNVNASIPVSSIDIESPYDFIFNDNGVLQLNVNVKPLNATYDKITWSIKSPTDNRVSINQDGKLTVKGIIDNNVINVVATVFYKIGDDEYSIQDNKNINVATIKINDGKAITSPKKSTCILSCNIYINGQKKLLTEEYGITLSNIKWELSDAKNGASISSDTGNQSGNTVTLTFPKGEDNFKVIVTVKTNQDLYISASIDAKTK